MTHKTVISKLPAARPGVLAAGFRRGQVAFPLPGGAQGRDAGAPRTARRPGERAGSAGVAGACLPMGGVVRLTPAAARATQDDAAYREGISLVRWLQVQGESRQDGPGWSCARTFNEGLTTWHM